MVLRTHAKGLFLITLVIFMLAATFLLNRPDAARGAVTVVPETVRVGLTLQAPEVSIRIQGNYRLISGQGEDQSQLITPGATWQVWAEGGLLNVYRDGARIGAYPGPVRLERVEQRVGIAYGNGSVTQKLTGEELFVMGDDGRVSTLQGIAGGIQVASAGGSGWLQLDGGLNLLELAVGGNAGAKYRGNLELRLDNGGLTVINELPIEEYLYGVVPAEVYASWPEEALKAQAVAARTYLLSQFGARSSQGFDVLANQMNQVYRGYNCEQPAATRAVDATAGQVLTSNKRPIAAFFHSSSGGYTENSEDVWLDTLSYIRWRPDPFDFNSRHYNWTVSYSQQELVQVLRNKGYLFNRNVVFSRIDDLQEVSKTASGARVQKLVIKGLDFEGRPDAVEVSNADRVRIALGLKSALFQLDKQVDAGGGLQSVTIRGSGNGHGLGMSQWGAYGMAGQGYNYQDILKYYYTGVGLSPNYGF
jgi:stage II sporulation protein D